MNSHQDIGNLNTAGAVTSGIVTCAPRGWPCDCAWYHTDRAATFQAQAVCRSLQLLRVKDLDVGASRNLQTGAVQRHGGFHLLHVAALAALEGVHTCQVAVLMQDAQHRWCDALSGLHVATVLLPIAVRTFCSGHESASPHLDPVTHGDLHSLQTFVCPQEAPRGSRYCCDMRSASSTRARAGRPIPVGSHLRVVWQSVGATHWRGSWAVRRCGARCHAEGVLACRDLWAIARGAPLEMLLWDGSHDRATPWYPFSWTRFLILGDGTFGPMTVLHTYSTSGPVDAAAAAEGVSWTPEKLVVATRDSLVQPWRRAPAVACERVPVAVPDTQQLVCGGASTADLSLRAVAHCPLDLASTTYAGTQSAVDMAIHSYGVSEARESRLAAAVSIGTAAGGAATSLGISYSAGFAAVNSGELGMALLSGVHHIRLRPSRFWRARPHRAIRSFRGYFVALPMQQVAMPALDCCSYTASLAASLLASHQHTEACASNERHPPIHVTPTHIATWW